jgi:hypothetical protein
VGAAANPYVVTVKDDDGFTVNTNSVPVIQPSAVTITDAVKTLYNGSDLSCSGATNGEITVTASGGTGTLTYSKDNGLTFYSSKRVLKSSSRHL